MANTSESVLFLTVTKKLFLFFFFNKMDKRYVVGIKMNDKIEQNSYLKKAHMQKANSEVAESSPIHVLFMHPWVCRSNPPTVCFPASKPSFWRQLKAIFGLCSNMCVTSVSKSSGQWP